MIHHNKYFTEFFKSILFIVELHDNEDIRYSYFFFKVYKIVQFKFN